MSDTPALGTIKAMHPTFGFIAPDDGRGDRTKDLMFIPTMVDRAGGGFRELKKGDRVSFQTEVHVKGLRALNVCRVESAHGDQ